MLGYVRVFADELKIKDYDRYKGFYCGVCQDIKDSSGQISRMTLNYDMTFMALLLTSLYDKEPICEMHACLSHLGKKKKCLRNEYTRYAADMCVLLTYHNLMDDWLDDRKRSSYIFAGAIKSKSLRIAEKYPRQNKALLNYLTELHELEEKGTQSVDAAANLTGRMLGELFAVHEGDIWEKDLRELGFHMGKYIYLMDAYEDIDEDIQNGNYNPLKILRDREDFKEKSKEILMLVASEAARVFERLPVVENIDILRNILYSGMWTKFGILNSEEGKNAKKNKKICNRSRDEF